MSGILPDVERCNIRIDCLLPDGHQGQCAEWRWPRNGDAHVNWCPTCGRTDHHPDVQAPAPISGEAGAVSAIADHSVVPSSEKPGASTITTPSVKADGAARPSYRQGLSTREHRLVRQLAEARLSWTEGKHDAAWFLEAAYAVADLVPILKCGGCEKLFVQGERQRKWCSERCRYRMGMRAHRARIKAASRETTA